MANEKVLVVDDDPSIREFLAREVLLPAGYEVLTAASGSEGLILAQDLGPDLTITDYQMPKMNGLELIEAFRDAGLNTPVILMTGEGSEALAVRALRLGVADYLIKPLSPDVVLISVRDALRRYWNSQIKERVPSHLLESNRRLERRLRELNALVNVGTSVSAMLDLEQVLNRVVESAVSVVNAEEGSLMLVDEQSGELYVRAAINFDQKTVNSLRLKVNDSLAGQVIQTGQPVLVGSEEAIKIKTKFLVKSLIYVPLRAPNNKVFGVLSVDNRIEPRTFEAFDLQVMSLMADFASAAIQNARLYAKIIKERDTLDAILHDTDDQVIVVDVNNRLLFCNATARATFNITQTDVVGQLLHEVFDHPELLALFTQDSSQGKARRREIPITNSERVLNAQLTIIDGIGRAAVMQDITHLKQLDRVKSEFVSQVAHDLRSPLTAVLGYSELLTRAGPLNEQQAKFVEQITSSVHSITELITELLELSRIESGYNPDVEPVSMPAIVRKAVENLRLQSESKQHTLLLEIQPDLPLIIGAPLRLQQMVINLIGNAIKYTLPGGKITARLWGDTDNVILQVQDTGIGIPAEDQPYIFDKFFRTERAASEFEGTGLGLSIVKGIVEQHYGRIWLESAENVGTTFTIVLPISPSHADTDPTRPRRPMMIGQPT